MKKINKLRLEAFRNHTLRVAVVEKGGGVEINLTTYGFRFGRMSAYLNYLGGGMLGSIQSDCNVPNWKDNPKLVKLSEDMKQYYAILRAEALEEEFNLDAFINQQKMPTSAY